MENKIIEIISEQFNISIEKIDLDTDLQDDLTADSLDLVELIMSFEDEFDLEIEDEDISSIKVVSDIVEEIAKKLDE